MSTQNTNYTVHDLPPPPVGKTGFPWTVGTKPPRTQSIARKITIVTPSYNQGIYIEETIRSVLLQNYPNLEYIIIDGGSTDETVSIIKKYAPFLHYWVSEKDAGQSNAINKGFRLGSGEIMGWLNSDDLLLPKALYHIEQAFSDPKVNFVTGFRKIIDEHSNFVRNYIKDIPNDHYLSHYCPIAQETTYWRREVWENLGELDEQMHSTMDYEYWLRAIKWGGYSFTVIPYYTGCFRDYRNNKSNSWLDVYYKDVHALYSRYDLGYDETDVVEQLGEYWHKRYNRIYPRISNLRWSNHPRLIQLLWLILENPIVEALVLKLFHIRDTLKSQPNQSPKIVLKTIYTILRSNSIHKSNFASNIEQSIVNLSLLPSIVWGRYRLESQEGKGVEER